jgi:hypothetical protein
MAGAVEVARAGRPAPYDAVRIALALVLLTAAGLKGYQLATEPVLGGGLLESRWFLIAVVEFEILFGLWLLSGLAPGWTWRAAVLCFGAFAAVSACKGLAGEPSCGCFGRVPVSPWYTLTFDLAVLGALFAWRPRKATFLAPKQRRVPVVRVAGVVGALFAVGVPVGFVMASYRPATLSADSGKVVGHGKTVLLEPERWLGRRFPLLRHIDIGERLCEGNWIVVLYHHDCPECGRVVPTFAGFAAKLARTEEGPRVALVEIPPYGEPPDDSLLSGVLFARLSDAHDWFCVTPQVLSLAQGKVTGYGRRPDIDTRGAGASTAPSEEVAGGSCGPTSLYCICRLAGKACTLTSVERLVNAGSVSAASPGATMLSLRQGASSMGFYVDARKGSWAELHRHLGGVDCYAILHTASEGRGHFIAGVGAPGEHTIRVVDPARGVHDLDEEGFLRMYSWQGDMLLLHEEKDVRSASSGDQYDAAPPSKSHRRS